MFRLRLVITLLVVSPSFADDTVGPKPPVAKKDPHKLELHGDTRVDDYFWLKDKKNPDVIKYLEAENAYTEAMTKKTEKLRDTLYKEMLGRIKQTDKAVPVGEKGFWYYSRTEEGKQYPIFCRKKGTLEAAEEIILDANELAKGEKFLAVGAHKVSDDGNLLAFTTDTTGFREYELSVKDLRTGKVIEPKLAKAPSVEWAADNKTLFYTTEDDAKRAHKVWRHTIGQAKDKDVLLFEEKDELFWLDLARSHDDKYLFHISTSYTSGEQRYLPADQPTSEWKTILPREEGHEYSADHRDGKFYIRTNKGALNFRIATCPVDKTEPANWKDFVAHDADVFVEGLTLFKDFAVVSERQAANPQLRVIDMKTGLAHRIEFTESAFDAEMGENPDFNATSFRFGYSSPVTPPTVYEYDPATGGRKLLKRTEVPGGFDSSVYQTERIYATSPDGTRVPLSIIYKKGLKRDGSAPCLLYGYGSYGIPMQAEWHSNIFSLLDRGVVYAWAHIRGGSDMGRAWYDAGKMMNKQNTFTDFIACADHLVSEKYCARDKLAIHGGSAGGLLVGAVLNRRPDLCGTAVLQVPFVDVLTTMADESLPLTVQEFQQWGNPKKKAEYEYMRQYCPYTNMRKTSYPSILVMTSLNDSQVMYHEPTKYVAKLRTLKTDANPLLLKCNMDAGHGGASGRYDHLKEQAFLMVFVLDRMGVK
ncbi:MAG TPA: S9 family peptidase [Gemmataceae bacterium]|jgi:oligopeptidase B|nr:S9 family peptidase [Gemmataceae bacterium]